MLSVNVWKCISNASTLVIPRPDRNALSFSHQTRFSLRKSRLPPTELLFSSEYINNSLRPGILEEEKERERKRNHTARLSPSCWNAKFCIWPRSHSVSCKAGAGTICQKGLYTEVTLNQKCKISQMFPCKAQTRVSTPLHLHYGIKSYTEKTCVMLCWTCRNALLNHIRELLDIQSPHWAKWKSNSQNLCTAAFIQDWLFHDAHSRS